MKRILLAAVALLMIAPVASAQKKGGNRKEAREMKKEMMTAKEEVKVLSMQSKKAGERLDLDFDINYDRLILAPNELLIITPFITDGVEKMTLRPVVFIGERCYKKEQHKGTIYGQASYDNSVQTIVLTKKEMRERERAQRKNDNSYDVRSVRTVKYVASFPYASWMNESKVILHHEYATCKSEIYDYNSLLGTLYNPEPVTPMVMFVVPEYETVKSRSESMTARVVFPVNKTDLRRDIFDNAAELDKIYEFTDNIINNEDLKVTSVKLKGFASPEGRYSHNQTLADGRVRSLQNLLQQKYRNMDKSVYSTEAVAEDWDSVRSYVAASNMQYRAQILDIIDNTADADARDAKIRALDRGVTYNMLLKEVYPGLRRTEFTIQYTVVPFTVERGKEVILTNPSHLSLHEFYQIAETYPMDSPEYERTFEQAIRFFPNDPVANNNMAALALRKHDLAKARTYLNKVSDYSGAQNNLGVLNALEGNYEAADRAFKRAIRNGSKEAAFNLENLNNLK